nr:ester cyclase [Halococcus saccharolyticus]
MYRWAPGRTAGIEPTGSDIEVQNMIFTRIEDGKIAERWIQPDMLGMMRQLDVLEDLSQ